MAIIMDKTLAPKATPSSSTTSTSSTSVPATTSTAGITPEGLERIVHHAYVSGSWSFLDHLLNPWWNFVVELFPMWVAPNVITLVGTIILLSTIPVNMYFGLVHCSDEIEGQPLLSPSANLYIALAIFLYQTLDAVDGKQARRTKSSSPLGQLFDHGCDALCTAVIAWNGVQAVGMGESREAFLVISTLLVAFLMAQWEEMHTHSLSTNVGGIGVTEGQVFLVGYHIAAAYLPCGFWGRIRYSVPNPITLLVQLKTFLLSVVSTTTTTSGIASGTTTTTYPDLDYIGISIRTTCALLAVGIIGIIICTLMYRVAVTLRQPRSLLQLLSPAIILLTGSFLFFEPTRSWALTARGPLGKKLMPLADAEPGAFFASFALGLTYITTQIIVTSMARDPFPFFQASSFLFPLVAVVAVVPQTQKYAGDALLTYLGVLIASYFSYIFVVMKQISSRLGIHPFKVTAAPAPRGGGAVVAGGGGGGGAGGITSSSSRRGGGEQSATKISTSTPRVRAGSKSREPAAAEASQRKASPATGGKKPKRS